MALGHTGYAKRESEIAAARALLETMNLEGRVVTADALHTQQATAEVILQRGGDYVLRVKGNQPQLLEDIVTVFTSEPVPGDKGGTTETGGNGHGRIETRVIRTSTVLDGYSDFPGLSQVFEVTRRAVTVKTGEVKTTIQYGVTSLSAERACPAQVLDYFRQHWGVENQNHWVRDVVYQEDASQVRAGSIPQVLAVLRSTVVGMLKWAGHKGIAKAVRYYRRRTDAAIALLKGERHPC
jgi:predicted transposase YbfD/YdcC